MADTMDMEELRARLADVAAQAQADSERAAKRAATSVLPTEPGWYWLRHEPARTNSLLQEQPRLVQLRIDAAAPGGGWVAFVGQSDEEDMYSVLSIWQTGWMFGAKVEGFP